MASPLEETCRLIASTTNIALYYHRDTSVTVKTRKKCNTLPAAERLAGNAAPSIIQRQHSPERIRYYLTFFATERYSLFGNTSLSCERKINYDS